MTGTLASLLIAVWLVGSRWPVALVARLFDEPSDIVDATLGVGILAGRAEWFVIARRGR